jgi:hypothetical protein
MTGAAWIEFRFGQGRGAQLSHMVVVAFAILNVVGFLAYGFIGVVFSNGWIEGDDGEVFLYYGSSDTRAHVATTTLGRLLDYALHTPEDGLRSAASVEQRLAVIRRNRERSP